MIHLDSADLGTLCICAIRYCIGKQSYVPDLVHRVCLRYVDKLSDIDIDIILLDCMKVERDGLYGDSLNKLGWTKLRNALVTEKERRERET